MTGVRVARNLSAGAVAAIAAVASYEHMRSLASGYGQPDVIANLMPLSVDGLIIVSTVAMADDRRERRSVRWSARVAFVAGVIASVSANVLATPGAVVARLISAWPAVALLMVVEVLSRRGKTDDAPATTATDPPVEVPVAVPAPVRVDTPPAAPARPVGAPTRETAPARGVARSGGRTGRPDTAAKVRRLQARYPDMTSGDIARRVGVTDRTVRRYLNQTDPAPDAVPVPEAGPGPVVGEVVRDPVPVAA